jgi:hypothetical protein
MTPNEAFDAGVAATGYIPLIVDPSLAISLLPSVARTVGIAGIEINSLMYNSPVLDVYRKRASPMNELKNRWPIRYDPRDLSKVWFWAGDFQQATKGDWVEIPARIAETVGAFSDVHLAHAKSLFSEADHQSKRSDQVKAVALKMIAMFERVNAEGPANRREERIFRLGKERTNLVADSFPSEPKQNNTDVETSPMDFEDNPEDFWDFNLDEIEPFPMADELSANMRLDQK